jgi:NADH:ubiquinone oxidoreductase subunit 4 (subunit M)
VTLRQVDLKKIIAYASVAHMNYVMLGLFSTNIQALSGSIFLMLSHGLVSSALFFCVGFLYDRYKTRLLFYYGGLVNVMPIFCILFLLFTLANMSFPGTSNFIGEFLVLIGLTENNIFCVFISLIGVILGACYSI